MPEILGEFRFIVSLRAGYTARTGLLTAATVVETLANYNSPSFCFFVLVTSISQKHLTEDPFSNKTCLLRKLRKISRNPRKLSKFHIKKEREREGSFPRYLSGNCHCGPRSFHFECGKSSVPTAQKLKPPVGRLPSWLHIPHPRDVFSQQLILRQTFVKKSLYFSNKV